MIEVIINRNYNGRRHDTTDMVGIGAVMESLHMQWFHHTAEALCSPNGSFVRHIAIISLSFPSLLSTFPCSGKALCVGGTHAQAHHSTHDFLAYLIRYHPSNFTMKTPPQISLHCEKSSSQHKTKNKKLWKLMSHFTRSAAILHFSALLFHLKIDQQ